MRNALSEADVEEFVLDTLQKMNYDIIRGTDENYLPGGNSELRKSFNEVILTERLRSSLEKINRHASNEVIEQAIKQVTRSSGSKLIVENENFHKMLVEGVDIPISKSGEERYEKVWLFDFKNPNNNEFLVINQFTVMDVDERRPDVILFVNGIPLVNIELKNPVDEQTSIWAAYNDHQTKMEKIPSLYKYIEILVIADAFVDARAGTITSEKERFMQWKTINGEKPENGLNVTEVLLLGMFDKQRLLDIVRNFIIFEKDKETKKKLAAYHQYWAANKALESTTNARKSDKKIGIVWHTQGSGKSLTMVFYTGKIIRELDNPTIVVLTDRNDLDDQLFGTFARCEALLRQEPVQADTRRKLMGLLKVSSGGVVFTTIQKFFPEESREKYPILSNRDNIIVIADEAHRSQYGFSAKIMNREDKALITYGYAKYLRDALPNASFIGFTGTPIEKEDRSTPAVFGKYVDVYDIEQAVNDGATVKIYYESRLAKLDLKPEERPKIDAEFEEVTEGDEVEKKENLKSKWAQLEKVAGAPERIKRIANDIVNHFEQRLSVLEGKGIIVCMARWICVELYNEIIKIRPEWHSEDDDKGVIKVVMTGSASDPKEWQRHIRNKKRRKEIGDAFKDPDSSIKLLIVRDMFLTGFDAPSLHTMYLDKPIRGHTLMQAIARVNRVYPGKEGGLVVDYMGVGAELKKALMNYTESGGKGKPTFEQEAAIKRMQEKYEVVRDMFHGFDYKRFFTLKPQERVKFIPDALEFILKEKGRKGRFEKEAVALVKAFSLAVPSDQAMRIRDEVGFFQAVKITLSKTTDTKAMSEDQYEGAIKQIISKAVISDRIIDIFEAAGIQKPELSILSEGFLAEVKEMPQKNLAFEALKKLLNDEIRLISRKNIVQSKSFMAMLDKTIKRYTNRSVEAAQVIDELIELARRVRDERNRGKELKLTEDEVAFMMHWG